MISAANGIEHRLIKPNHPWSNGQVERMNRTIRDAPRKRFHSDTHEHLGTHLGDFMAACNFERRHKSALEHYTAVRHVMIASQGNAGASRRPMSNRVQVEIVIHIRDRTGHAGVFGGFHGGKGAVHLFAQGVLQKR